MKIFKSKIVAVVLTLMMVLSIIAVPVSAADVATKPATPADAAAFLNDAQLLQGDENGDLMLENNLTREQMVVILSRLMGQEEDALSWPTDYMTFQDVPLDSEYAPYIAWAQDNMITQGYTEEEFGFGANLTAEQTKLFFVRVLGYSDLSDEEQLTMADDLGITEGSTAADKSPITREDMALLMSNTLYAQDVDGNVLGETLGVITPEPSVTAPVLSNVAASEATTSAAKVTITGTVSPADAAVTVAGTAVTVAADGTFSAEVAVDTAAANGVNTYAVVATKDGESANQDVTVTYVAPATVTVSAIKALNLKQVEVDFTGAVDKTTAEDATNYAGVTLIADTTYDAVLQADGKTVILNLKVANIFTQYTDATVTVSGVKDSAGTLIVSKSVTLTPSDVAIPTLVSAVAKGNQVIQLTFSEPIQNAGQLNFKIDTNAAVVGTANADGTVVNVATGGLTLGDHTIALVAAAGNELKDYAGYLVPLVQNTVTVSAASAAVTVTSVVPNSQTKATVTFSDAVTDATAEDVVGNYYFNTSGTAGGGTSPDSIKKIDDKTFELTFTTTPLTTGNIYMFVTGVKDYFGNLIAYNVQGSAYKTAITVAANALPVVTSVTAKDDSTIVVTFNNNMKETYAENASYYTIKDSKNAVIAKSIAADGYDDNVKQTTITTTAPMPAGSYTVAISGIQDAVGNTITAATFTINPTDTSAPAVPAAVVSDKAISLSFTEALAVTGNGSALNLSNYQWQVDAGTKGDLPGGTTIAVNNNNKTVVLTFPATVVNGTLYVGYIKGNTSYNVADAAGNLVTATDVDVTAAGASAINVSAGTTVVSVKTPTTVSLNIAAGKAFGTVVASDFQISLDNTTWFSPVSAVLDADDTDNRTIIFTVADANKFTAADMPYVKVAAGTPATKDAFGSAITGSVAAPRASANKIAASLVGANLVPGTAAAQAVYVLFDSPVNVTDLANEAKLANSLVLTQGSNIFSGALLDVSSNTLFDKEIIVKLAAGATYVFTSDQALNVKTVSKDLISGVDINGNVITENTTGVEAATQFVAQSLVKSVTAGTVAKDDVFTVTFNRNVDGKSFKSDWNGTDTIAVTGTVTFATDGTMIFNGASFGKVEGLTVATATSADATLGFNPASIKNVTVTLTSVLGNAVTYTGALDYVPDANIKSTAGTAVNAAYKAELADAVAPVAVANATNAASFKVVSATTATVVFNEKLLASTFVAADENGFAVGGGTAALTKAELGADGVTVTLTGTDFVAATTTIAYTAGSITDVAGNSLATFGATATH